MYENQNVVTSEINVWIEKGCIACERCIAICPDIFEIRDDYAQVKDDVNLDVHRNAIKEAAAECPVQVIQYEE
jgi:ferredoxin